MKIWATMTSIILLSGMLGFGFSPDAFAGHVDGKGKALGCEKGMAKNNPHCVDEPPATVEGSPCNTNGDGEITSAELQANTTLSATDANNAIQFADTSGNGSVDNTDELALLQTFPGADGC